VTPGNPLFEASKVFFKTLRAHPRPTLFIRHESPLLGRCDALICEKIRPAFSLARTESAEVLADKNTTFTLSTFAHPLPCRYVDLARWYASCSMRVMSSGRSSPKRLTHGEKATPDMLFYTAQWRTVSRFCIYKTLEARTQDSRKLSVNQTLSLCTGWTVAIGGDGNRSPCTHTRAFGPPYTIGMWQPGIHERVTAARRIGGPSAGGRRPVLIIFIRTLLSSILCGPVILISGSIRCGSNGRGVRLSRSQLQRPGRLLFRTHTKSCVRSKGGMAGLRLPAGTPTAGHSD